jgi:lipopolysaccharide export system permease protein
MKTTTRYIVYEVLKSSATAMLLLLTLFDLFTFSDELDDIGKDSYGLTEAFYFVLLTSPTVFYELMPASALLGSLFALGSMANHNELIAMRAAGLSIFGIIRATLLAGTVMAAVAIGVGEFIAPDAEEQGQTVRATAHNKQLTVSSKNGLWLREGKQFINVRSIEDNGELTDISIYELDDQQQLIRATHAEQAVYIGKKAWQLQNIKSSAIATTQIQAQSLPEQLWQSSIAPDLLKIVVVNANNLSLYDLATYISFLKTNHQKSQKYELAFWGRVVNPLVIFVMLMVSTPFVIGVKRGISSGARILIGVVIGMSFNVLDMSFAHLGLINEFNPIFTAALPSVLMLGLSLVAIRRLR